MPSPWYLVPSLPMISDWSGVVIQPHFDTFGKLQGGSNVSFTLPVLELPLGYSAHWSVSGNATIVSAPVGTSVRLVLGLQCGPFELRAAVLRPGFREPLLVRHFRGEVSTSAPIQLAIQRDVVSLGAVRSTPPPRWSDVSIDHPERVVYRQVFSRLEALSKTAYRITYTYRVVDNCGGISSRDQILLFELSRKEEALK